jgi:hypothetical protein
MGCTAINIEALKWTRGYLNVSPYRTFTKFDHAAIQQRKWENLPRKQNFRVTFQAALAKWMIPALFWDITQRQW